MAHPSSGAFTKPVRPTTPRWLAAAAALLIAGVPAHAQDQSSARPSSGTCVAIPLPTVQGATGDATSMASSVRDLIRSYLAGPRVEVVALDARLAGPAAAEASERGCAHLLTVRVIRKPGKGNTLGRVVGTAAHTAAWRVPYGVTAGSAVAAGAAAGAAHAVATMAESTRAKDELRIEYQLAQTASRSKARTGTFKAKASVDNEDLLTPLVGELAESILTSITPQ